MEFSVVETGSNKMVACENIEPEILFRLKSFLEILRCASVKFNSCCSLNKGKSLNKVYLYPALHCSSVAFASWELRNSPAARKIPTGSGSWQMKFHVPWLKKFETGLSDSQNCLQKRIWSYFWPLSTTWAETKWIRSIMLDIPFNWKQSIQWVKNVLILDWRLRRTMLHFP